MNATITLRPTMSPAMTPPATSHGTPPAGHAWTRSPPQRLSVWDERARKMGFPPSTR